MSKSTQTPERPTRPEDRDLAYFAPRVTVTLLAGVLLFGVASLIYSLPVLLEAPPPGAIPDYTSERVAAHLEGKVLWILTASMLAAGFASIRGLLPGTRHK
jgi:hypothetical protein